jgi:hypothetical protein
MWFKEQGKWSEDEDYFGNSTDVTYIVPDTTPFDIPEGFDEEGEISQEEAFRHIPPRPATRMAKDMTLREHYAGMAMQGILASPTPWTADCEASTPMTSWKDVASGSAQMADALIAALNQKEEV